ILFANGDAPIRQILTEIASGDANASAGEGWSDLSELGAVLGARSLPWIANAQAAEIALCADEIVALARQSRQLVEHSDEMGRAALWAVSVCTLEALARLQRKSARDTENYELYVQNLSLARDPFLCAVAETLIARRDGHPTAADAAAQLSLTDD